VIIEPRAILLGRPVTRIRRNPASNLVLAICKIAATGVALPSNTARGHGRIDQNGVPGRLSFAPVASGRMAPLPRLTATGRRRSGLSDRLDVACDRQLILSYFR
jgi:hypothetical protein